MAGTTIAVLANGIRTAQVEKDSDEYHRVIANARENGQAVGEQEINGETLLIISKGVKEQG